MQCKGLSALQTFVIVHQRLHQQECSCSPGGSAGSKIRGSLFLTAGAADAALLRWASITR